MKQSKNKAQIRKKFKDLRSKSIIDVEELIQLEVRKVIDFQSPKSLIGIYWPLAGEVDLRFLKKVNHISLALPACKEKGYLSYHRWGDSVLIKDIYGIPAPLSEPLVKPSEMKLLIVPALAIDYKGIRLGYGGGCYDRLRSNPDWKKIKALAIVPNACVTKKLLPKDVWDIPFDGWINEKETFFV